MRHFVRLVLVATIAAGCSPSRHVKPEDLELAAGAAQSEWNAETGPPGAWVYVVLAGLENIESRLQSAAQHSGDKAIERLKKLPQEMLRDISGKLRVPAEAIDLSRPMAIVVYKPVEAPVAPMKAGWPVAAIVPITGKLQGVELVNGYAVASDSTALATRVRGAFQSVGRLEAPQGIARVYIDLDTIVRTIGDKLYALAMLSVSPRSVPNANGLALMRAITHFHSILGQIENLTLNLDASGDAARVGADVTPKWGTDIAQLTSNQAGGTALESVVPGGALTLTAKLKGMSGRLLRFTEQFLKIIPDAKEADTIREPLANLLVALGDEFALTYDFGPEGLSVDMAARFTGSMDAVRKYYHRMASYKLPERLRQRMRVRPAEVDFAFKEPARQVDGVTIDRFTMKFNVQEGTPPIHVLGLLGLLLDVKEQTAPLWGDGEVVTNYAVVNDTWVMARGGKNPDERIATLISKAKNPPNSGGDAPVKFKLDLFDLMKFAGKTRGGTPPSELAGGAPVTGTIEFPGSTITMQATLPLKTVAQVAKFVERVKRARQSKEADPLNPTVNWPRGVRDSLGAPFTSPKPNRDFIAIAAGPMHSLGLKKDGSIVGWLGWNKRGECNPPEPNRDFVAISAGDNFSLGLKKDGSIVAWGRNFNGECSVPEPNRYFVAIAAGSGFSLGLREDGTIIAWGDNRLGTCNVPLPNRDFVAVSAGIGVALGLKKDGSVVAWGKNATRQGHVPEPNRDFVEIASLGRHSLGLKKDGSVACWGLNNWGQCDPPEPNREFVGIAAGSTHSLGLKKDGSLVAWGRILYYSGRQLPEPNGDFAAIAAGMAYNLALKKDGSIVGWGLCPPPAKRNKK